MTDTIKDMDPQDYFDYIKSKKLNLNDEFLNNFNNVIQNELSKAMSIGQNFMVKRLAFTLGVVERERQLVDEGVTTYVLKEDITYFIDKVADKACKMIELEYFPRSIPDDIAAKVSHLMEHNIFDRFYIVFTDYTGEAQKQVENERKRKDPIIFGAFEKKIDGIWDIHDRLYFIGDWEDEYCDLTLTKMVEAMSAKGKDIVNPVGIEKATIEEIRAYVNALEEKERDRFTLRPMKKPFWKRIRTLFTGE